MRTVGKWRSLGGAGCYLHIELTALEVEICITGALFNNWPEKVTYPPRINYIKEVRWTGSRDS